MTFDSQLNHMPTLPLEEAQTAVEWGVGPPPSDERLFLRGPQSRVRELIHAIRLFWDIIQGFRKLHFVGPCVTVFGSARFTEQQVHYQLAREVGYRLAKAGFTVMTGGGPGIMEAANRGAREAGGLSVGCNIELPHEQKPNDYLDHWVTVRDFGIRKLLLIKYSYAFITLPGGFGTLDEIFSTATLIQTEKIQNFPLILMGVEYWKPMMQFLHDRLLRERTIDAHDLDRLTLTDSPQHAVNLVVEVGLKQFGLSYGPRLRRRWWLGE